MGRRKRFLDDDSSDDSDIDSDVSDPNEDPDARAERLMHQDPYQRGKRRRRGRGKDSATYGVFGDDSEEEDPRAGRRADLAKAPAFVSGKPTDIKADDVAHIPDATTTNVASSDDEEEEEEEEDTEMAAASDSDSSDPVRPASPRPHAREPSEEPAAKPVGFGSGGQAAFRAMFTQNDNPSASPSPGLGSRGGIGARGGIGSGARSGLGASTPQDDISTPEPEADRPQRSFLRTEAPKFMPKAELSATERQHFAKISGGFGAKMLSKMGWEAGTGLGATREGIVTPIESKLRPQKAGIAYRGFSEKTDQSKREEKRKARREGKVVSSDSDEPSGKKKKKKSKLPTGITPDEEEQKPAWKRPKKSKIRVEHKTYEEIVQDAGIDTAAGIGQIIDATGAVPREVGSITDVSGWAPTADTTRLVEIRHNIRMIVDLAKGELDGLAREARALNERKKWVENEEKRLRTRVTEEADLIARLQRVHLVVDEISAKAKVVARDPEPKTALEQFTPYFDQLLMEYSGEYERHRLDEVVVASVAPTIRRAMAQWEPLDEPTAFTDIFRRWKKAFRLRPPVESTALITQDLRPAPSTTAVETQMTPYESMLWSVWLPRVRSSINNDWSPTEPHSALSLFDAWRDLLPAFVHDNVLDQLIIPKIQKAVADWTPKKSHTLQSIVFPWLPHVGLRMEDLVGDAKRKVRSSLRTWKVGDGVPTDLVAWKDIFGTKDWDNLLLKHVIPKLGSTLREEFSVNPRAQDMGPLQAVLEWMDVVRVSVLARVIEAEFFQKWLNVLHVWLVSPRPNFDEIAQWYQFWKGVFPKSLLEHPSVANGFERGLQLMNSAMALGPNAPARLARPDLSRDPLTSMGKNTTGSASAQGPGKNQQSHAADVSFRTIVEEFAAAHNLLVVPTQRTHERSRMPLYRVSGSASGKGGILIYLLDDIVWTGEGDEWKPVSLEEMVLRATKKL